MGETVWGAPKATLGREGESEGEEKCLRTSEVEFVERREGRGDGP